MGGPLQGGMQSHAWDNESFFAEDIQAEEAAKAAEMAADKAAKTEQTVTRDIQRISATSGLPAYVEPFSNDANLTDKEKRDPYGDNHPYTN